MPDHGHTLPLDDPHGRIGIHVYPHHDRLPEVTVQCASPKALASAANYSIQFAFYAAFGNQNCGYSTIC